MGMFDANNGRPAAMYSSTLIGQAPCVTLRSFKLSGATQMSAWEINSGIS